MSRTLGSALLVVAAGGVMVLRAPTYFTDPGFWAEEGLVYFAQAWTGPWWRTLVAIPAGYLLLYTNVAVILAAHLVPLRAAPLVTTLMAFAAQLAPVGLVAFGEAPEWRGPVRKTVGVAIVLFASLTGEIWLNTINSQFHLSLLAVLILLEPPDVSGRRAAVYAGLLFLCGLTGPVSCFLAPLYVAKAWRFPSRPAIVQAAVLVAAAALQAVIVWSAASQGATLPPRTAGITLPTVALVVWMKTLVLPVLGANAATTFIVTAGRMVGGTFASPAAHLLGGGLLALAVALVAWLTAPLPGPRRLALAGSYGLITLVTIASSIGNKHMLLHGPDSSSRYFYVPGAIILVLLLANVQRRLAFRPVVCALLLAVGIGAGIARYRSSLRWRPTWPSWRSETAAWERDQHHALRIWPPGWRMQLGSRDRAE